MKCFSLVALFLVMFVGCSERAPTPTTEELDRQNASSEAWLPLPGGELNRIAFGSCTQQVVDQPIWNTVVDAGPDLFLHLGDTIYPDHADDQTGYIEPWPNPNSVERIRTFYEIEAAKPEFIHFRSNIPIMAVWDDHDYGINDGDADFDLKKESQQLFLDFFGEPEDSERRGTPGVYDANVFGPEGRRIQVVLLDTRYFRTPPTPDTRSAEEKETLNIVGRYAPIEDPEATILGVAQWHWLEEQLNEPAEVRLLVSSYPVISDKLGRDSWGNFPLERQKLFELIGQTEAHGVIFLSGDVHFAEISRTEEGSYPLLDFTSSPLAAPSHGNENFKNPYRISDVYTEHNFGLIEIDWDAAPSPLITLKLMGVDGAEVFNHSISLEALQ